MTETYDATSNGPHGDAIPFRRPNANPHNAYLAAAASDAAAVARDALARQMATHPMTGPADPGPADPVRVEWWNPAAVAPQSPLVAGIAAVDEQPTPHTGIFLIWDNGPGAWLSATGGHTLALHEAQRFSPHYVRTFAEMNDPRYFSVMRAPEHRFDAFSAPLVHHIPAADATEYNLVGVGLIRHHAAGCGQLLESYGGLEDLLLVIDVHEQMHRGGE